MWDRCIRVAICVIRRVRPGAGSGAGSARQAWEARRGRPDPGSAGGVGRGPGWRWVVPSSGRCWRCWRCASTGWCRWIPWSTGCGERRRRTRSDQRGAGVPVPAAEGAAGRPARDRAGRRADPAATRVICCELDPEQRGSAPLRTTGPGGQPLLPGSAGRGGGRAVRAGVGAVAGSRWPSSPRNRSRAPRSPGWQEQRLTALTARIRADLAVGRHAELIGELEDLAGPVSAARGAARAADAEPVPVRAAGRGVGGLPPGPADVRRRIGHRPGPGPAGPGGRGPGPGPAPGLDTTTRSTATGPLHRSPATRRRATTAHGADHRGDAPAGGARVERAGPQPALHRPRRPARPSCTSGCAPDRTPWWCRPCTAWAGSARPNSPSSTPTGTPPTTTWCGGSTPNSRCSSPTSCTGLAGRLGLPTDAVAAEVVNRVLTELGARDRWLLIFDNAEHPDGHRRLPARRRRARPGDLPHPGWGALGGRIEVDVLDRADTVALLRARIPEMTDGDGRQTGRRTRRPAAGRRAGRRLPGTDRAAVRRTTCAGFRTHRAGLLAAGDVLDYQGRVDTTWAISLERLQAVNPAAVALLEISAFLAPEPIPLSLFTEHPDLLDEPLRSTATDPDALADAVGAMVGFSLARRQPGRLPAAPPAADGDPQPDAPRPTRSPRRDRRRAAGRGVPRRPPRTGQLGRATAASPRTSWPPARWATPTRTVDTSCSARSPTSATRATRKQPGHSPRNCTNGGSGSSVPTTPTPSPRRRR